MPDESVAPRPKRRGAKRSRKRRGTPRPNLAIINARRQQEAAARRGALAANSESGRPPIEEFVTSRQYLGLTPSAYQLTLLKALYGRPLSPAELEIFRECTGGREYPARPFSELTAIAGARSGKNAYILTPALLFEAIFGGFTPNPGETCAVVLVAQDARAARLSHRLAREYLKRSPLLSKYLVGETKDTLTLSNGIEFRVFPCTGKSIYGFSIIASAMDEVARFRFEGAADSDEDVQAAIQRGMVHYGNRAKLIKVSSPSSRAGLLYQDYQRSFGKPDPHRLVWQSTSEKMAPGVVDAAFIQRMREEDPLRAARLYDAEFSEDVNVFLSAECIEAATEYGVRERLPEPRVRYIAACDPAGHGEDAMTLSLVKIEGDRDGLTLQQVLGKAWSKPRSGLRNLEQSVVEASADLKRYVVRKVYGDRAMSGWVLEAFRRQGIEYEYPFIKRDGADVYVTRSVAYLESAPLLRAGRVRILDDEVTRREFRNLEQRGDKVDHGPGLHDDRANALALAICMAVQSAVKPSVPPMVWTTRRTTSGEIYVDGKLVTGGRAGMSPGYSGPDIQSVHPHERAVSEISEADRRMGMSKAQRWRQAWGGQQRSGLESSETVFASSQCQTCGVRVTSGSEAGLREVKAQHHLASPRCRGGEWK